MVVVIYCVIDDYTEQVAFISKILWKPTLSDSLVNIIIFVFSE